MRDILERVLLEDPGDGNQIRTALTWSHRGIVLTWAVPLPDDVSIQQLWESGGATGADPLLDEIQSLIRRHFAQRFAAARATPPVR